MSAGSAATERAVALAVDSQCSLGEGATWCARTARLYWTDIEGARLWCHDARDGAIASWPMPERLASFALCADPQWLLLGLAKHLAFFNCATGAIHRIVEVEPDLNTRLNDGRCDRQGRFVFGTKDEGTPTRAVGGVYRLNRDLTLERLPLPAPAIANGIAFSPDGATMYYCDSPTREIRACDYGDDGRVTNDRTFTTLGNTTAEPDGSTVDADGGIWNAQWAGARVVRYGPDGVETDRVPMPVSQPTCVAFGGAQLDTLYVTSARIGLDADVLAREPQAGGVFAVVTGRRGIAEPCFQGALPQG